MELVILVLIRKEILNNLLNSRFSVAYFVCTVLFVGSSLIMFADLLAEKRVADTSQRVYERRMAEIDEGHLYTDEKYVARPVVPTQMFALGGERDPDRRALIGYETAPMFFGDFRRDPLGNLFPAIDPTFIVGVLFSLLIFMLVYDAVSGERELGTLKLLLSSPISRDRIMVAKWLGAFISVLIPYLTSAAIVVLVLLLTRGITIGESDWARIGAVLAIGVLYMAVVLSISLAVSVLFRSSAAGILSLLLIWATVIVALPALSTPIAYLLVDPPSVQQLTEEIRREASQPELREWLRTGIDKTRQEMLDGRDEQELSDEERWAMYRAMQRVDHERIAKGADAVVSRVAMLTRYERNVDRLMRRIARLSPYGCMQNACVTLAGTDMEHELAMREANGRFMKSTISFWKTTLARRGPWNFPAARGPRYRVRREPVASAFGRAAPDIGVLLLTGCVFFLVAFAAFLRADPT
ncbi:MAG: ABC transporter permease subunit [Chitinivibrionales bacterium]|nr:ABC transporter permease subunit [Chitinivibrionales bacterium]